jgi:hypothetical protein
LLCAEPDGPVRDVVLAHCWFRHTLLAHYAAVLRDFLFSTALTASLPWPDRIQEFVARHPASAAALQPTGLREVTRHYTQRWCRQVLDPRGFVSVADYGADRGFGLCVNGNSVHVLAPRKLLWPDTLDGIIVHGAAEVRPDADGGLMSVITCPRPPGHASGSRMALLAGPLSLINQDRSSALGISVPTWADTEYAREVLDRGKAPENRFWHPAVPKDALGCAFVRCLAMKGDGRHFHADELQLQPGQEIVIAYR